MGKGSWSAPARHRANGRYQKHLTSQSVGWGPRPEHGRGETIAGVVRRDRLGETLASLHLAGFGSNSRVLDGARGDLSAQLERSGVQITLGDLYLGEHPTENVILLVHAPGRGDRVVQLLRGRSAVDVQVVNPLETDKTLVSADAIAESGVDA